MSGSPGEEVAAWADARIEDILSTPRMWGGLEAVELQIITLLEVRAAALDQERSRSEPRRILDTYNALLRKRLPEHPHYPLATLARSESGGEDIGFFEEILREIVEQLRGDPPRPPGWLSKLPMPEQVEAVERQLMGENVTRLRHQVTVALRQGQWRVVIPPGEEQAARKVAEEISDGHPAWNAMLRLVDEWEIFLCRK